jgi:hypothetical protein
MTAVAEARVDPAEVKRAIAALIEPGAVVEVRALIGKKRTVAGYFTNDTQGVDALVQGVTRWGSQTLPKNRPHSIYITLNRIDPQLLGRYCNRLEDYADVTTADANVTRRRWLLVDVDPVRPAGVSATDAQHAEALRIAGLVALYLQDLGIECILADSGNGGHVLVPVDLEASEEAQALLVRVLKALGDRFNTDRVHIDQTTFNASRIAKLPGTIAGKGDSTPEQPHRQARLLHIPENLRPATVEQLQAIAGPAPAEPKQRIAADRPSGAFDIEGFLGQHCPEASPQAYKGGRKWQIQCPFDPSHTKPDAVVFELTSGALGFKCSHNSCSGRAWSEFRDHFDPEWARRGKPVLLSPVESVDSTACQPQNGDGPGTENPPVELLSRVPPKIRFVMTAGALEAADASLPEKVSAFPMDALPATLARLVENAAPAIPVPPDFIAIPMLTICGAAIGRAFEIEVKRNSWWETARLWAVVIGDPGTVKSPALGIASAPMVEWQNELHRKYREDTEKHAAAEQIYQCDLKAWRAARAKGDQCQDPPIEPAAPHPQHVYTDDGTVEGITRALYYNPRGLIFLRDELAGWVSGMNQFKQNGNDRQTWLSYWSGTPRNTVRAAAEEFHVAKPFVSVCGTIQPEILGILEDERGRQDGFVHRVLLSFPEKLPQSNPRDRFIDPALAAAYAALLKKLLGMKGVLGTDGAMMPIALPLSLAAEEVWNDWLDGHCAEMNHPEFSPALAGPWAKMKGYAGSYTLIFEVVRCAEEGVEPSSVDAESVRRAIRLIDYHKSHARVAYPLMKATEESLEVRRAVKWMQKRGVTSVTPRELQQARIVETADAARKLLLAMEQRGYGSVEVVEK